MKFGYIGLIMLLISLVIIGLMFVIMNPFSSAEDDEELAPINADTIENIDPNTITNPKRIQQTQDVIDNFQQQSTERQSIEIK